MLHVHGFYSWHSGMALVSGSSDTIGSLSCRKKVMGSPWSRPLRKRVPPRTAWQPLLDAGGCLLKPSSCSSSCSAIPTDGGHLALLRHDFWRFNFFSQHSVEDSRLLQPRFPFYLVKRSGTRIKYPQREL